MKIAQGIVGIHNSFPQSNWSDSQALPQELQAIDSATTNIPMAPQGELNSRHIESSNNMQQQTIVTDGTGATNSLIESVKSDSKKSHMLYSQSANEVLDNQLSAKERAKIVDLETMTSNINDYSSKLQDQFRQTSDSTIIRTILSLNKLRSCRNFTHNSLP
jgi:hypothetical protein